jgi:hypothetical protein
VACVPDRVRDRLLGDAVDRGADQRAQTVEVAGQLHVDARTVAGTAGQPLQVGDAALRRELGLVAVAQRPDQRPQVGQGA